MKNLQKKKQCPKSSKTNRKNEILCSLHKEKEKPNNLTPIYSTEQPQNTSRKAKCEAKQEWEKNTPKTGSAPSYDDAIINFNPCQGISAAAMMYLLGMLKEKNQQLPWENICWWMLNCQGKRGDADRWDEVVNSLASIKEEDKAIWGYVKGSMWHKQILLRLLFLNTNDRWMNWDKKFWFHVCWTWVLATLDCWK